MIRLAVSTAPAPSIQAGSKGCGCFNLRPLMWHESFWPCLSIGKGLLLRSSQQPGTRNSREVLLRSDPFGNVQCHLRVSYQSTPSSLPDSFAARRNVYQCHGIPPDLCLPSITGILGLAAQRTAFLGIGRSVSILQLATIELQRLELRLKLTLRELQIWKLFPTWPSQIS